MSLFTSRGREEVLTVNQMHKSAIWNYVDHGSDGNCLVPDEEASGPQECVGGFLKISSNFPINQER